MFTKSSDPTSDEGFGLVEVVVAMLLLATLAIAILPLLIQGLKVSAANTTQATAVQLVNDRLQAAQAVSPDCDAVAAIAGTKNLVDGRNVTIRATTTVAACPLGPFVGTVKVRSVATRIDTGATLAAADTLVYVNIP